ncbi:MAG: radical SAM protein [Porcipelethomonas sp.]
MNLSERYRKKLEGVPDTENSDLDGILLQIEVTNICNHKCCFCPNQYSVRSRKIMDVSFAERIIDECNEFLGKDRKICFHMNGEPLLYKELPRLIRYSKQKNFDYCFITTNGSAATDELLTGIFEAGLDSIKFSINAGSNETYKKIHGQDDFEKAIHALKFSSEYKKKHNKNLKIYVSCVGTKDNFGELEKLNKMVEDYCDETVFYYPCGYAGQNNSLAKELRCDLSCLNIKTFDIKHSAPCSVLWNSINVTCEGYLALCCSESDNRLIVEDLNSKSVKEAWLGEKMNRVREKHLSGEIHDLPCYSCITEKNYDEKTIEKDIFELSLEKRKQSRRVKNRIEKIDYSHTQDFFRNRAEKFKEENPYSVTMYQDDNPVLVKERNKYETEKFLSLLKPDENSKILDIACGIGRWSDAIKTEINEYCGVDFSEDLIKIARKRNENLCNRFFYTGSATELKSIIEKNGRGLYSHVLMIGILMYLNEDDVEEALRQVGELCQENAVICIREPVGLENRLTLKNFYSDELDDFYNAIYRTKDEILTLLQNTLLKNGFRIAEQDFLFDDDRFNNRKETAQYYFILKR